MSPPRQFLREIRAHNRHCWLAAASSLFFAWLVWLFLYGVGTALVLLFATVVSGHEGTMPGWWHPAAGGIACGLLAWGAIDDYRRRYRPPPDRPVVGWHLASDAALLAPRLTFGVAGHAGSRIRLTPFEKAEAWKILLFVAEKGKVRTHELGGEFPDAETLRKGVDCLSVLGWIDLHRGEEGWFYLLRSSRAEELEILPDIGEPGEEKRDQ